MDQHFNKPVKRHAEFITPPNMLKVKVGSGGLSDEILGKAQELIEKNTVNFLPLAEVYLASLMQGIDAAKNRVPSHDDEYVMSLILYPVMQLKANGGMFHYPLVTKIADRLIQFLEVIEELDIDAIEIVLGFHTTIRAVVLSEIKGDGGKQGTELMDALDRACYRYLEKNPDNANLPEA